MKKRIYTYLKKIVFISFILISILALTLIGYDVLLKVKHKLDLRNMGQFTSKTEWVNTMKEKAVDEYLNMPRMKGNLGFPRLITQFKADKYTPIYTWQTAGLLLGLYECTTEDEFVKIVGKRKDLVKLTGEEVDSAMLAYALSFLPDESYADKDQIVSRVLEDIDGYIDRNHGTIMYRDVYPTIRFIDTIGLVCPFLAVIAEENGYEKYRELALLQIEEFNERGFNDDYDYLPFHGFDLETETPLGKYGWGRGTGWYALGLIDTYSELDENERKDLEPSIIKLAESLKKYQKKDGGWGETVNNLSSQTETSATALFLYFIKRSANLGLIEKDEYGECVNNAENCLMYNTTSDGRVMNTEGECIALGNYSYDYKHMPFTQGMTLRAVCLEW